MSTDDLRVPIWGAPEPGTRRPRFTREQIAATALAIADRDGFDAISMRRVATELGAATMSLYHYVRTKDDLIALMHDHLMAEVVVPEGELPEDWRGGLTTIARSSFGVFLRHPWVLTASTGPAGGPNALRHFDQSLAAVKNTPLQPAQKLEVLFAVDDYVFGHALRRRELADHTDDSPEWAFALIQAGGYPELRALLGDDFEQALATWEAILGELDPDRAFETGLAALLDGLALRFGLEEPAGAPSGDDAPA